MMRCLFILATSVVSETPKTPSYGPRRRARVVAANAAVRPRARARGRGRRERGRAAARFPRAAPAALPVAAADGLDVREHAPLPRLVLDGLAPRAADERDGRKGPQPGQPHNHSTRLRRVPRLVQRRTRLE